MKIKQTFFALGLAVMVGVGAGIMQLVPVSAVSKCGNVDTSIISCTQTNHTDASGNVKDTGVWWLLLTALNILTASVGIAAVGGVVYAAILYSSASDNTEQVKKARDIIRNIIMGIVAFALMYVGLNFLIPGGIFQ